jgi:hypothetical protein
LAVHQILDLIILVRVQASQPILKTCIRILTDILDGSPSAVVDCVRTRLSPARVYGQRIQLPQTIALGLKTKLGPLPRGLHDEFVPLVIVTVLSIQTLGT